MSPFLFRLGGTLIAAGVALWVLYSTLEALAHGRLIRRVRDIAGLVAIASLALGILALLAGIVGLIWA